MGIAFPVQIDAPGVRQWLTAAPLIRTEPVANYRPEDDATSGPAEPGPGEGAKR
jgi:hypothetical protein